ncbi:MAG: hypothetical protein U0836_00200 [Pirellulales bacterium]
MEHTYPFETTTMNMRAVLLAALALAGAAGPLTAGTVVFDSSFEYSSGTAPAGAPPWLRATFDDGGKSGSVTLTFAAQNLVGSEFVSNLYFNLDPTLDPTQLVFGSITKVGAFDDPAITAGVNAFKAGPDGKFDLQFAFATSGAGGGSHRFGAGESISLTISGIASLVANSFDFLSAPDGPGLGGPGRRGAGRGLLASPTGGQKSVASRRKSSVKTAEGGPRGGFSLRFFCAEAPGFGVSRRSFGLPTSAGRMA